MIYYVTSLIMINNTFIYYLFIKYGREFYFEIFETEMKVN
jgi:hypothetical protein